MERDTPYGGNRFAIKWKFQNKDNSEALKIDLCAGDDVDAEKLETMSRFATGNTRLKDFIDLWGLIQIKTPEFSKNLKPAIIRCFTRRKTVIDPNHSPRTSFPAALRILLKSDIWH